MGLTFSGHPVLFVTMVEKLTDYI